MKKASLTTPVTLDGALSWDYEEYYDNLRFRWDFNSDGTWDTDFDESPVCTHVFDQPGESVITMQVIDSDSASAQISKTINIVNTKNLYSNLLDKRNNQEYAIVLIGNHWWMAENLNYGEPVSSNNSLVNNSIPEMYVYQDQYANRKSYGGLYTWAEAVAYDSTERACGLCPLGWHIPDDAEWMELEAVLGVAPDQMESPAADRGDPAGTELKIGGSSGFEAGLYGHLISTQGFYGFDAETGFWSSTRGRSGAWTRTVKVFSGGIQRSQQVTDYAFYVRCIKNE